MSTNEECISVLRDSQNREVALKGVTVRARLHDLIAEVEVEQSYVNPRNTNVETIYTFPLPIGAVLLGLEVEIAGKRLSSHVIERKKAERDYEEAVTDGNSAVLLQEVGPGLYTASIGNLMAKESALVRYRYALMLCWQGDKLRFQLPTTIAPRYGDASAAGMEPHQVPKSALDVEYPLSLTVVVEGALASAEIASPTHPISFESLPNGIAVKLARQAVLDRDFVLTMESEPAQSSCTHTPDGDEHVAVASIRIPPIGAENDKPLALKLLIDCSGSMGGTSIGQARKAALEILNALSPKDYFSVTLFGSECTHLFPRMVPANGKFITEAWNHLERLEADMGGTEMESALTSTFALGGSEIPPCVLLITDGEVHEHEKLVQRYAQSAHRIFTVGVGAAIVDVFLESLARTTSGACELVSPQEGMAEKILSQFHRLRQPKLKQIQIDWPTVPVWTTPLPKTVFAGDTVHVFAGFKQEVTGPVTLHTAADGNPISATTTAVVSAEKELPRIAAAHRIVTATQEQALALSVKYQLLSKWTSYLVVAERDVKANELPELHQVPQMLAAGWGGTGAVASNHISASVGHVTVRPQVRGGSTGAAPMVAHGASRSVPYVVAPSARPSHGFGSLDDDIPFGSEPTPKVTSLPKASASVIKMRSWHTSPRQFVERLAAKVCVNSPDLKLPETVAELDALGLDGVLADEIRRLLRFGYREVHLVTAMLHALSASPVSDLFDRNLRRLILKRWKDVTPPPMSNRVMKEGLKFVTADAWGREYAKHGTALSEQMYYCLHERHYYRPDNCPCKICA